MDWVVIGALTGLLLLLGGMIKFFLNRWDKRAKLVIQLFKTDYESTGDTSFGSDQLESVICMRIVNVGTRPVVIERESLKFGSKDKLIDIHKTDWVGIDKIPSAIEPGKGVVVGVFQDAFEKLFGVVNYVSFMNTEDYEKCTIHVFGEATDVAGKRFSSGQKYQYSFYVSEFWPAQHVGS